jgi:hypothetical protein
MPFVRKSKLDELNVRVAIIGEMRSYITALEAELNILVPLRQTTEDSLDLLEKLWNRWTARDGAAVIEIVSTDVLPMLKKYSEKYKDVNVEEANARIQAP